MRWKNTNAVTWDMSLYLQVVQKGNKNYYIILFLMLATDTNWVSSLLMIVYNIQYLNVLIPVPKINSLNIEKNCEVALSS